MCFQFTGATIEDAIYIDREREKNKRKQKEGGHRGLEVKHAPGDHKVRGSDPAVISFFDLFLEDQQIARNRISRKRNEGNQQIWKMTDDRKRSYLYVSSKFRCKKCVLPNQNNTKETIERWSKV